MATSSVRGSYWLRSGCSRCHYENCIRWTKTATSTREQVNIPASSLFVVSPPQKLSDRKRKRRRKRNDNSFERQTPTLCTSLKETHLVVGSREKTEASSMEKRIRVLPQQLLEGANGHDPQEPAEPPPPTTDLVSLLIVGDSTVGKSSLIKSFVSHYSAGGCNNMMEEMGAANYREPLHHNRNWSVSYSKKKFLFMNKHNILKSLYVQLLEASDIDPYFPTSTSRMMSHQTEWKRLWKKTDTVVLVVNLSDSIETILKQIQRWKQWLDCHNPHKPVVLMLHQGDTLMPSHVTNTRSTRGKANPQHSLHHPSFWIRFGKLVSDLCHNLGIKSWHITSSCLEDDHLGGSVDAAFREILGDKGKPQTLAASFSASLSTQTPLVAHPDGVTPDRSHTRKSSRMISPL
jgi:hypothetical protein